ncbi:helix-turn-helix transcriptional regulator [Pseudactinotalea sp. Z1732]|uniref:helix-turn-helix transcriptional regulator n=1 Tax=Micrococcales TaxID=85006 RepID=UPI003C79D9FC
MADEWQPSRVIDLPNHARLSELLHRTVRLSRDPDPLAEVERASVFVQALLEVYRQDARTRGYRLTSVDPRIQQVMDLVRYDPSYRLQLTHVAESVGLSPDYFSRLFSQQVGTNFRVFVLQARLERGFELLRETRMTVAQVGRALGYDDPFLFSRQFRERYGCPPSRIRATDT